MLIVISPAKTLDWEAGADLEVSEPQFGADALRLAKTARGLTLGGLRDLMGISEDLARLNRDRFKAFEAEPEADTLRPAAFAFAGDTYKGLEAETLDADALRWAQDRLRILSGLYGVLRPLDGIQPYRLEMGSRLKTRRGASLYDYWGDTLAKAITREASALGTDTLVNCASQEYFGALERPSLKLRVITPVFLEERNGTAKTVGFFAKRARGALARFALEHRLTDPEALKDFDLGGYTFQPERSEGDRWVFARPYPDAQIAA